MSDRTRFAVASAKEFTGTGYDLVCFFDCLHDMGDPVGALAHTRAALAPDGTVLLVEPYAGDEVDENLNPIGRVFYAASSLICTPASQSQEVGLALGASGPGAVDRCGTTRRLLARSRRDDDTLQLGARTAPDSRCPVVRSVAQGGAGTCWHPHCAHHSRSLARTPLLTPWPKQNGDYHEVVGIRVVIAEDNFLLRDGMSRLLRAFDDIDVVGLAGDLDELLAAVDEHGPDVVLTDIRMPPTGTDEGIRAAAEIRQRSPSTGVVVLSQHASAVYAVALFDGGSDGRAYLLKDRVSDADQLVAAIRSVAAGGSVVDPKIVEELLAARNRSTRTATSFLTPREREVLGEMAQGKTNAAIATTFSLSERGVEKHINSIFSKLHLTEEPDVNRRVKAVLLFVSERGS